MAEIDIRAVLQYIPQFGGRVFVVLFEDGKLPEAAVAESLLDLLALQKVGVRLALGTLGGDVEALANSAIDLEIKVSRLTEGLSVERANEILDRGQAVLFDAGNLGALDAELVNFSKGIGASKLIALSDGDLVTADGEPLVAVSCLQIPDLVANQAVTHPELLEQAGKACAAGIDRVHLLNGQQQGVLVDELFSNEGVGTMVYTDSYQEIRELREEDIPELLAMIGRTVRATWLVPRHYEDIREKMEDYLVMTIDDNVVGCVALHHYADDGLAEVACLYVKQAHEGCGYGRYLVDAAVEQAKKQAVPAVFALTTRAQSFFQNSLGWDEWQAESLPNQRRQQWTESQRGSLIFGKSL